MICKICKQEKDISEYYSYKKKGKQYYKTTCKKCITELKRERYKEDLDYCNKLKIQSLKYAHSEIGKKKRKINHIKRVKTNKYKEYRCWYAKNTEKGKESFKRRMGKWLKTPNGKQYKLRKSVRRRSKFQDIICSLTAKEWEEIINNQKNKCKICEIEFTKENPATQDHIIPLNKNGNHIKDNIQALCRRCNSIKGDKLWQIS